MRIRNWILSHLSTDRAEEFRQRARERFQTHLEYDRNGLQLLDEVVDRIKAAPGENLAEWRLTMADFICRAITATYGGKVHRTPDGPVVEVGASQGNVFAWVDKRFRSQSDTIWFKVVALFEAGSSDRVDFRWSVDLPYANDFARELHIPEAECRQVNLLIQDLLSVNERYQRRDLLAGSRPADGSSIPIDDGPWSAWRNALPAFVATFRELSPTGRTYLAMRLVKASDCANGFWFGSTRWLWPSREEMMSFQDGLDLTRPVPVIRYLSNAPRSANGHLFDSVWGLTNRYGVWESLVEPDRTTVLVGILEIIRRPSFHHDIRDFKQALALSDSPSDEFLDYVDDYRASNDQGCYRIVQEVLGYPWNTPTERSRKFKVNRDLIFLLDGAPKGAPRLTRKKRLAHVLSEANIADVKDLLSRIAVMDDAMTHRLDRWTVWADDSAKRMIRLARSVLQEVSAD